MKGSNGRARLSAHVIAKAVTHFYSKYRLFPTGVVAELESVQDWAMKCGRALKRLVPREIIAYIFLVMFPSPAKFTRKCVASIFGLDLRHPVFGG